MGVFDNELILPGAITEITSDFSFGYDESLFGTTDTVTIIGTAFNGPTGKPVAIYSPEHANYVFGEAYDYKTRREATLVAEIKDAWDRGCRSIYAIRVSGKDINKDFSLVPETKIQLRVAGLFPSNSNKDVYMTYSNAVGAECIKIFKPANRATLQEKREGLVDRDDSVLVTKIDLAGTYALTADSRLVELIKIINEHAYNNVLRLSLVDENGADVTVSSKEAQALSVGAMFPGAYFIGRDKTMGVASTKMSYKVVKQESDKPYESFDQPIFKVLTINSDINTKYPIYAEKVEDLNAKFQGKVIMSSMFDFLEVPGKADEVFAKDKTDYEEAELSEFELYKRLGSGFATTAKVTMRENGKPKVSETPTSDANRIKPLTDGIYSMLESLKSDYRVLAGTSADASISGKLPKASEFEMAIPAEMILENLIAAKAIVAKTDMTAAKKYTFEFKAMDQSFSIDEVIEKAFVEKVVKSVSKFDTVEEAKGLAEGSLVLVNNELYRAEAKGLVALTEAENLELNGECIFAGGELFKLTVVKSAGTVTVTPAVIGDFGSKEFILIESGEGVYVYGIADNGGLTVTPVGSVADVFGANADIEELFVVIQSEYGVENKITVQSAGFDTITLEELIDGLNSNKDLAKLFSFALAPQAGANKDEYIEDTGLVGATIVAVADRAYGYDTSLYIPYRTTDNFARHLAQHVKYTSLKTAPTHGVIGCARLLDTSINSVAQKVKALLELNLDLYAKKPNGTSVLDRNNLPYPIGSCVSVVFGQYTVATLDGYTYISNGGAGYAGMISSLPIDQSSTNQTIDLSNLMFELTNYQLEKLTQKGYVTFKQSYTKGIVVTDGVTMESSSSPFRRLSTARITNKVEELIREATEPYIGKQNHLANRNSMQTAVKSKLEAIKGQLIKGYTFKLVYDAQAEMLGIVDIDYRVVPVYEIREVRNRITVTNNL